ncbi:hypothetical protein AB0N05_34360 [Nocardia sp. NPDC051030]|uniref:hypothetical protein n=1 Tax=Nocardia sp. NPDC051030 TaxID=3155162 RepID=UPI003440FCF1
MSDELTPQDALDIASASTRRARSAQAGRGWVPPVAALLCFGTFFLFGDMIDMLVDRTITVRGVAGIVVGVAFGFFMPWVIRAWRNGGVVPRSLADEPLQRWKRTALGLTPFVAFALLSDSAFALVMGVWVWIQLARPRIALWRN